MTVRRDPEWVDLACADDLDPDLVTVTGDRVLAEACYRRLVMSRLWYDATYGLGAHRWVLETGLSQADIASAIQLELLEDERVARVETTVLTATLLVRIFSHRRPTFPLTLEIDRVSAALLSISPIPEDRLARRNP